MISFFLFVLFQAGEAGEESSDSDGEQEETSHKLIRKVSTSGQIRAKVGEHSAWISAAVWTFLRAFLNFTHIKTTLLKLKSNQRWMKLLS